MKDFFNIFMMLFFIFIFSVFIFGCSVSDNSHISNQKPNGPGFSGIDTSVEIPLPTFDDPMSIPGKVMGFKLDEKTVVPVKIFNIVDSTISEQIVPSLVCIFGDDSYLMKTQCEGGEVLAGTVGEYNITFDPSRFPVTVEKGDEFACMIVICNYAGIPKNCKGIGDDYMMSQTFFMRID
jgi:hypothetical protein